MPLSGEPPKCATNERTLRAQIFAIVAAADIMLAPDFEAKARVALFDTCFWPATRVRR
jgi:hypothetical protein